MDFILVLKVDEATLVVATLVVAIDVVMDVDVAVRTRVCFVTCHFITGVLADFLIVQDVTQTRLHNNVTECSTPMHAALRAWAPSASRGARGLGIAP